MMTTEKIETVHAERLEDEESSKFYVPEKYQLGLLTDYLNSHGFEYVTEGRVFCYPIDILCARQETTVAIEMKSGKLSRGIEQAWRNSDFVDFSYLAVWEDRINESLLEAVSDKPIGLFAVDDEVKQISSPSKTTVQLCSRDAIFSTIRENVRNDTSVQQSE
ncbi:uncharacterized protein HfgLR_01335 [Haloferax gibbonsii]|uniref:Uncharacterized protein n=1 Tax=Haloferax gibbonsii TaxID=35746 RepID=A0A871BCG1_HALGI|nr:hypothetical protein [Haloferax gibbonsii]QOS10420.1 uncharacterized protein HfgLR_01335 [Haloferax gibbonsii]